MTARKPETQKEWLTVLEVSIWLDVGTQTVRRWVAAKELIAFEHGRTIRISMKALEEFMLERSTV